MATVIRVAYYVWYDARDTKDGKYVALTSTLYALVKTYTFNPSIKR